MRYIIDLTDKQANEVQNLINCGNYRNVNQFIGVAVDNQLHIEDRGVGEYLRPISENVEVGNENEVMGPNLDIEKIESVERFEEMPKFSDLVEARRMKPAEEEYTWLWGQANRLFPIKLGLRVLLKMQASASSVNLNDFSEKAAEIAAIYGAQIRKIENENKKNGELKLSAGLPSTDQFKSMLRYKTQFLANIRNDGALIGALPFLRFVALKKDKPAGEIKIGLTKPGMEFAQIKNPIIDFKKFEKSLSGEECTFYLEHIKKSIGGEYKAVVWLLKQLQAGCSDRENLDREIKKEFSQVWHGASDAIISTQRAGLMSRMYELGLFAKEKSGNKVAYIINDYGKKILDSHAFVA